MVMGEESVDEARDAVLALLQARGPMDRFLRFVAAPPFKITRQILRGSLLSPSEARAVVPHCVLFFGCKTRNIATVWTDESGTRT